MKIQIDGIKEAVGNIDALEKKMRNSIIRKGLRAGGKVWRDAARGEAPSQTGKLKRSIKVRAGTRKKESISIAVGMGAKDYVGSNSFYGAFIEYGFHIGKRSLGDARKLQPANPFMKRAFDQSNQAASDTAIETMKSEIEGTG